MQYKVMKLVAFLLLLVLAPVVAFAISYHIGIATLPQATSQGSSVAIVYDTPANYAAKVETVPISDTWYNGCAEFACAAMLLNAYGESTTIPMLLGYAELDNGDGDFVYQYLGNINSKGAIYSEGLALVLNKYIHINKIGDIDIQNISGEDWSEIKDLVNSGVPVACWFTRDYQTPVFTDTTFANRTLYEKEHCVVVVSAANGQVEFFDPQDNLGRTQLEEEQFQQVWTECGRMAVRLYAGVS